MLLYVIGHPSDDAASIQEQLQNGAQGYVANTKNVHDAFLGLPKRTRLKDVPGGIAQLQIDLPVRQFSARKTIVVKNFFGQLRPEPFPGVFLVDAEEIYTHWRLEDMIHVVQSMYKQATPEAWNKTKYGIIIYPSSSGTVTAPTIVYQEWDETPNIYMKVEEPEKPDSVAYSYIYCRWDQGHGPDTIVQSVYRHQTAIINFATAIQSWALKTVPGDKSVN